MKNENQVILRKDLIDKVVSEFPHFKHIAENIEKSEGRNKQRLEKNLAQVASNVIYKNLTPSEILELNKASKIKI